MFPECSWVQLYWHFGCSYFTHCHYWFKSISIGKALEQTVNSSFINIALRINVDCIQYL